MKILSLFANIGVAEAFLHETGFDVVVANELENRRAKIYSKIYPNSHMICGDITDKSVFEKVIKESIDKKIDIIMATPPCQGMSTAGLINENDERNRLIIPVINAIKEIEPKYVFIENVPLFFNTEIEVNGKKILIPNLIKQELESKYIISQYVINTKDYSVPQTRERAIILMTHRKKKLKVWELPSKDSKIITMREAIGHLPMLDPFITDVSEKELLHIFPHYYERKEQALKISKWHVPPHHILRQVIAMQHTPTGCTAFDNELYYPTKANGEKVKGYRNTYKRQNWDTPAYTVTMDNRKISSQNNVHPGRLEFVDKDGNAIYSDARTLTLYELMLIMSLPENWPIPDNASEAFIRRIIGEGIPPLFVKKVFESIGEN
jgi:DNA (cytosine-5)-methyltransferase 1